MRTVPPVFALLLAATLGGACSHPAAELYVPGLGELMTATQARHVKLWFAGSAGNWPAWRTR